MKTKVVLTKKNKQNEKKKNLVACDSDRNVFDE